VAFPRISDRTVAYRGKFSVPSAQGPVSLYLDLVVLMHSRAQSQLSVVSALVPPQKAEVLRLARIVAGRMATAMRGS
jgi:hypothetical protein